jgi:SAM-dependent methyltransferase
MASSLKDEVREFWDRSACGEVYADGTSLIERLEAQARARYELEPYLPEFARFRDGAGLDVLEVGVGMGADHLEWAKQSPRTLTGIDLTPRAVELTRQRLAAHGLRSDVRVGDAERLPFADESFDLVYSWGVLHHSPDTARAVDEVWRVLRPGGRARVMIYHRWSIVGAMLWTRYALLRGHPLRSLDEIYANHLESPGTKAYSVADGQRLFARFERARVWSQVSFGDLLEGEVGQRHRGRALAMAKKVWPRRLIKHLLPRWGLILLIEAWK